MNAKLLALFSIALGVCLFLALLLSLPAAATESVQAGPAKLYVAPGGDCGDGTVGLPCYASPQQAVDAAQAGDHILVASGIYTGLSVRFAPISTGTSLITQVLFISKTIHLQGGYTVTNWLTPDAQANRSILDAQGQGRGLAIVGPPVAGFAPASPGTGQAVSPTVEGLWVTGGDAVGLGGHSNGEDAGGGIYVRGAAPVLRNNVVFSNTAILGGGICLVVSSGVMEANTLRDNSASFRGGGIQVDGGQPRITGNAISDNRSGNGGGVHLWGTWAVVDDNTISGNRAGAGGGVVLTGAGPTLNDNTISDNRASFAGGLHVYGSGEATLNGNLIRGNRAKSGGGGLGLGYCEDQVVLQGNVILSNTATSGGGLLIWASDDVSLVNNAVIGNQTTFTDTGEPTPTYGSGICVWDSKVRLSHNTLAGNTGNDGSGLYLATNWSGSTAVLTDTIVASQTVGVWVEGGSTAALNGVLWHANGANLSGTGTINLANVYQGDPAFAADGYHLTSRSAALERGLDARVSTDIDGQSRPYGLAPDLGADEFLPGPAQTDLEILKKFVPAGGLTGTLILTGSFASPGQPITYTLHYTNNGPETANVQIVDPLPTALIEARFRSSAPVTPLDGLDVGWLVGDLAPGEAGVITVTGLIAPYLLDGPTLVNTASITGYVHDTVPANNSSRVVVDVVVAPIDLVWHGEYVDWVKVFSFVSNRHLQLDDENHPHLAYGGNHLYYAWHNGTRWRYETVDEAPNVGKHAALALDQASRPHISYLDVTNQTLKYAFLGLDGRGKRIWRSRSLDSVGHDWMRSSIAVDLMGRPHILYNALFSQTHQLRYAWHDGTDWQIETVDQTLGGGSLALDSLGRPHVSYCQTENLKHAWRDGAGWQVETVDAGLCDSTSIALDKSDRPRISYRDLSSQEVKYAWYDGNSWQTQVVGSEYGDTSLRLDSQGRPHIVSGWLYVWHDGTTWQTEQIQDAFSSSLALDDAGRPHVSGVNSVGELAYAWHDGAAWQGELVDSQGDIEWSYDLALDPRGQPHIGYVRNGALEHAWHDGVAWSIETVDVVEEQCWLSLAADAAGRPHIAYSPYYNYASTAYSPTLKHAWHDGTAWQIETIETQPSGQWVYLDLSLALEAGTDRPHVSYCLSDRYDDAYRECLGLRHAWYDGTAWQVETVDEEGDVGRWAALALDSLGRPHVSYQDKTNLRLKYAWQDGDQWHIETADDGPRQAEGATSLALDSLDRPHISYRSLDLDSGEIDLRYLWHDGTGWQAEVIDSQGGRGSLAVDADDRPHVLYSSWGLSALVHTWRDQGDWQAETVVSEEIGGTAWALDGSGQPRISYLEDAPYPYDGINGLKYVRLLPSLFLFKKATPSQDLLYDGQLTYTLSLFGPGQPARLWDPLPNNVTYVSGSLTSTLAPPVVYSPALKTFVWQGTIPSGSLPIVRFQVTPNLTDIGSLALPIVNTAWLVDTERGLSTSATATATLKPIPLALHLDVAPQGGLGQDGTLTYTLTFTGPRLNVRLRDPLPANVQYVSGSLTGSLTPPVVYSPSAHALLWLGQLPTEVTPVVQFRVTPTVTGTGSLSLRLPIVNTAWLTNLDSGQTISATVIVNSFRVYLPIIAH